MKQLKIKKSLFVFAFVAVFFSVVLPAFAVTMIQPSLLMNFRQSVNGVEYFPLKNVADYYGIAIEWDGLVQKAVLYKDGQYFTFMIDEPIYLLNEQPGALKYPAKMVKGQIMLPKEIAFRTWWQKTESARVFPLVPQRGAFTIDKVVLDPGHGGKDHGARAYGLKEKDINLAIAKKIRDKLQANGVTAVMTRETDRFIPLPSRAQITNRSDADLFISIHANANPSRTPSGFEVYFLSEALDDNARAVQILENSSLQYEEDIVFPNKNTRDPTVWDLMLTENRKESIELAKIVSRNVQQSRLTSTRGVKSARFHVLKWTDKPAILVETGFITNPQEARKLAYSKYQDELATQIARAILEYKEAYERTEGFTK